VQPRVSPFGFLSVRSNVDRISRSSPGSAPRAIGAVTSRTRKTRAASRLCNPFITISLKLGWLRVEFTNSNTIYLIMIYFALMTPFVAINFLAQTFIAPV